MTNATRKAFVEVLVDPTPALPLGCCLRYKAESAVRLVRHVRYEPDDGVEGVWAVCGVSAQGETASAQAVQVEDSGAGTSWLIWGGAAGLRLTRAGVAIAETHLLLALDQLVD